MKWVRESGVTLWAGKSVVNAPGDSDQSGPRVSMVLLIGKSTQRVDFDTLYLCRVVNSPRKQDSYTDSLWQ
jgi:hypothetical protein